MLHANEVLQSNTTLKICHQMLPVSVQQTIITHYIIQIFKNVRTLAVCVIGY